MFKTRTVQYLYYTSIVRYLFPKLYDIDASLRVTDDVNHQGCCKPKKISYGTNCKKYESNGNIVLYSDEEIRALEGVWERYMAAWKACTEYEYQFLLPLRTRLDYAKDMLTDARGRAGIYFDDWGSSSEDEPGDFWKGCDD